MGVAGVEIYVGQIWEVQWIPNLAANFNNNSRTSPSCSTCCEGRLDYQPIVLLTLEVLLQVYCMQFYFALRYSVEGMAYCKGRLNLSLSPVFRVLGGSFYSCELKPFLSISLIDDYLEQRRNTTFAFVVAADASLQTALHTTSLTPYRFTLRRTVPPSFLSVFSVTRN